MTGNAQASSQRDTLWLKCWIVLKIVLLVLLCRSGAGFLYAGF